MEGNGWLAIQVRRMNQTARRLYWMTRREERLALIDRHDQIMRKEVLLTQRERQELRAIRWTLGIGRVHRFSPEIERRLAQYVADEQREERGDQG